MIKFLVTKWRPQFLLSIRTKHW